MAQFDLYRIDNRLAVDLQTNLIALDNTRIVAPLRRSGVYAAFPLLTPQVEVEGQRYIVRTQELAAIAAKRLGSPVGDLRGSADDLLRALDILTRGF